MSDVSRPADNPQQQPAPAVPRTNIPTVFVDGLANVAMGAGTVRTFLTRSDPSLTDFPATNTAVVLQVITTIQGFVSMAVAFQLHLDQMIEPGPIQPEEIANIRRLTLVQQNAPKT